MALELAVSKQGAGDPRGRAQEQEGPQGSALPGRAWARAHMCEHTRGRAPLGELVGTGLPHAGVADQGVAEEDQPAPFVWTIHRGHQE